MPLLGLICFLLAALDVATALLGISFTSVNWSPVIFLLLSGVFFALEYLKQNDRSGA
jgi:hypothetical protein